ncbi:glycosyltransferase family 2 protein [Rhodoferax sp.]|uniref:glycosyltransferase family 2 protein n=1 Tax=Rhodoferax sp. TaxID=50421 RepID=UPI0025E399B4|nr:glycosyltransferase family 2 protein [Rhodoferax sp.]
MNPSNLVSVVITTYNRSDALLAVLEGFVRQVDRNFEVIVADDGSRTDHRQAILESAAARALHAVHVWHPDVGFSLNKNRNNGVAASNGKYLIFMDGDCVPEVDFIAQHRRLAEPGYFVNGSRVLLSQELTYAVIKAGEHIFGRSWLYWSGQYFSRNINKITHLLRLPDGKFRIHKDFKWKGIRGCNLAAWRCDYELVDGFDESFVGWGHDDADFVLRLHHAGVVRKNGYCATEVYHLWHQEASRNNVSLNADTVRERVKTDIVRSTLGYSQNHLSGDVVVTRL